MFRKLALAAPFLLAGCSALSAIGDVTAPVDSYDLTAPEAVPQASGAPTGLHLIVEVPDTGGAIDTDRILIRPTPLQAQYLPQARWTEPVPVLLQTVMLRTLAETDAFRYVGRRPLGGSGDYALISQVTDFHATVISEEAAQVQVQITARLVREEDAAIVSVQTFRAAANVRSLETLPLVNGYDAATDVIMRQVADWTLRVLNIPAAPAT